jgi:hypothetical protein
MSIFHKHNWKEIARTYQPSEFEVLSSTGEKFEISGWIPNTHSYTTILWECTECQKTKKELLQGKLLK